MVRRASPRLKVYQAQFGFHDSVVAAPNQTAALAAWGTRQNLFAEGQARVAVDEAAIKAALAHPQTPLRRPAGSNDPFEIDPANLPTVPAAPKTTAAKTAPRAKAAREPPPDRSELDAAEAALAKLEKARRREEAALVLRREALETDEAEAKRRHLDARGKMEAAVKAARAAYLRAGG